MFSMCIVMLFETKTSADINWGNRCFRSCPFSMSPVSIFFSYLWVLINSRVTKLALNVNERIANTRVKYLMPHLLMLPSLWHTSGTRTIRWVVPLYKWQNIQTRTYILTKGFNDKDMSECVCL